MTAAQKIVNEVSRMTEIPAYKIMGKERHGGTAFARKVCYFMLRQKLHWTFQEIGAFMSRDHSTVILGEKRIREQVSTYKATARRVNRISLAVDNVLEHHIWGGGPGDYWEYTIPEGRIKQKLFMLKGAIKHYKEIRNWIESQ